MTKSDHIQQAQIFTHYLIRKKAHPAVLKLYARSFKNTTTLSKHDLRLLAIMQKYPLSIGFIDAGLAISNPHSEARRRIYVMLAILEASPLYHNEFLPKKRSRLYALYIFYVGAISLARGLLGVVIVKVIAR